MENNNLSASLEDYLEAIYQICQDKQMAHANHIAEYLKVSKSSVSWALNQLSQKELINYTPYEAITLSDKGRALGQRVARRHQQIKNFLTEVLGINEKTAEANACRLEHILDKEILQRMGEFETFLEKCPRSGREWMKGFGLYCKQGQTKENCAECISECFENVRTASSENISESNKENLDESVSEPVPKLSKDRDHNTLQRLKEVLQESGTPLDPPELTIADTFMATEKHLTALDLYKQAHRANPEVAREDVETVMGILCEHKIARAFTFKDQTYYEHLHPESHHDHLFCVKCGAIVEFFDPRIERLQEENARRCDFRLLRHTLNIYGVCHDCIKLDAKIRNLSDCLNGERVQVVRVVADRQTQDRITDMGLSPGSHVEILSDNCTGDNIIVVTGATRIMLDQATAGKIRIVPISADHSSLPLQCRRHRHRHAADRVNPLFCQSEPNRKV